MESMMFLLQKYIDGYTRYDINGHFPLFLFLIAPTIHLLDRLLVHGKCMKKSSSFFIVYPLYIFSVECRIVSRYDHF